MEQIRKKLRGTRGETLVETLVGTLVIVLAIALMSTMVASAMSIDQQARDADKKLFDPEHGELTLAEGRTAPVGSGTTVSFDLKKAKNAANTDPEPSVSPFQVQLYGTDGGLVAYGIQPPAAPGGG